MPWAIARGGNWKEESWEIWVDGGRECSTVRLYRVGKNAAHVIIGNFRGFRTGDSWEESSLEKRGFGIGGFGPYL